MVQNDELQNWINEANNTPADTSQIAQLPTGNVEDTKVTGFWGGVKAGWENYLNIDVPNVYGGYKQTDGILAGLGSALGNPVNDVTALLPLGIIGGSIAGAVSNTATDYISRKNSDAMAEYSYADLAEQILGGIVLGGAIKGIGTVSGDLISGAKGVANDLKGKLNPAPADPIPNVTGLKEYDPQFINNKTIEQTNLAQNGVMKIDDSNLIDTNNPLKGFSDNEIDNIIKSDLPTNQIPDIPEFKGVIPEDIKSDFSFKPFKFITPSKNKAEPISEFDFNNDMSAIAELRQDAQSRLDQSKFEADVANKDQTGFNRDQRNEAKKRGWDIQKELDDIDFMEAQIQARKLGKLAVMKSQDELDKDAARFDKLVEIENKKLEAAHQSAINKFRIEQAKNEIIQKAKPIRNELMQLNNSGADNYLKLTDDKTLIDEYPKVKTAIELQKTYGDNPEKIGYSYNNLAYNYKNKYLNIFNDVLDKDSELKEYFNNPTNKREIFHAIYGSEGVSPLASRSASLIKELNQKINNDVNLRGSLGFIENRIGKQYWDKNILNKVTAEQFYQDLINAGYKIKSDNGIRDITLDDADYIKSNLDFDRNIGSWVYSTNSKPRVLHTDNADGAFLVEAKYGGNKSLGDIMRANIQSGSKLATTTGIFGNVPPAEALKIYQNFIPGSEKVKIDNLIETISPSRDGSLSSTKLVVSSINSAFATGRIVKSVLSPYWQTIFGGQDLPGSLGLAMSEYGQDLFTGLRGIGLDGLKEIRQEMTKYSKISIDTLKQSRDILRNNAYAMDSRLVQTLDNYTNKAMSLDVIMNGSHFVDGIVRKTSGMLFGVGEHQRIINGGTIEGVDRNLVLEAMKGKYIPDGDVLLNKAQEFKANGDMANADKYSNAGNAINAYMQERINLSNPLVYRTMPIAKGSAANLLPLRMGRWVWNSWLNINGKIFQAAYSNARNGRWGNLGWNIAGLSIYGAGIGVTETFLDYMLHPEKYKDDNDFYKSLAKNTAAGMTIGSLYIPASMGSAGFTMIKNAAKATFGDDEKAKEKLLQSSWVLQAINWIHQGLQ